MKKSKKEQGVRSKASVHPVTRSLILIISYCLIIVCICAAQTPSQYHVVRVVGHVESPVLKREIKTGDVIQSKDKLKFGTKESYIVVNSPQTGRKRISGVPDTAPREFLHLLQSFVQPELKSTASRNISIEYVEKLQNSMAFDTLLILGDGFIPVNTQKLSLTKPAVVRAWYVDEKKKRVYRPISTADGFFLNSKSIYGEHGHGRVVIEYFEDENEDPMFTPGTLLGAFVPLFVDEISLASEIKALLSDRDKTHTVKAEVGAYLREEYAPVQEENLKAWLHAQGIATE